jgi:hypothetical protein
MHFDPASNLSFILKPTGDVLPAMPDDEEFSLQQIRDYVAGTPEVVCETRDGFLLFRNKDADAENLPLNPLATSIYNEYVQGSDWIRGRAFLAHAEHVARYWRRTQSLGSAWR